MHVRMTSGEVPSEQTERDLCQRLFDAPPMQDLRSPPSSRPSTLSRVAFAFPIASFFAVLLGVGFMRATVGIDLASILLVAVMVLAVGIMARVGGDLLGLALAALIVLSTVPTL